MSSIQIPRVLSQRGKTQYEIERENFEKHQTASIQKAVNSKEEPVKEKHVRTAIIGTYQEKSGLLFWGIVTRSQLQDHPIICWKFSHVVHKVLREGHHQVISDTQRYSSFILDLGKLWGHLKEGYGRLIAFYTKLLVQKLAFHKKYPQVPGNLNLDEEEFEKLCNNDINQYFELSVDMLDYMDDILSLQAQVFGSLDMSRSNSMTSTGQCRLAPLILCIQDSCQLYDYIVKILFRLHSSLPPDTLGGHRDRFYTQYKGLKRFYHSSGNLQYFKNLIKVPSLPDNPPNFLRQSDLSSHVAPVAIVPDPEPEPPGTTTPETESVQDLLIDTEDSFNQFSDSFGHNGVPSPPVPDDRDRLIEQLMREINELKQELARIQAEDQMMIESLRHRIHELEAEVAEMKQIAESTQQENETLRNIMKETEQNSAVATQMAVMEKAAKANEDKFKKMKEIYSKLREEHVNLLRGNAEVKRVLEGEKKLKSELETKHQETLLSLATIKAEKCTMEAKVQQSSAMSESQLAEQEEFKAQLEEERTKLESELYEVNNSKNELEASLQQCGANIAALQNDLQQAASDRQALENKMVQEKGDLSKQLIGSAVDEGKLIINDSLNEFDDAHHSTVTCTAEYLLHRAEPVIGSLNQLHDQVSQYTGGDQGVSEVVKGICEFSHRLSDLIINGKATSNSAPIEQGDELSSTCKNTGEESIALLDLIKTGSNDQLPGQVEKVTKLVKQIMSQAEELVPKIEDTTAEQMADLIDLEMAQTSKSIEAAADRFAALLAEARESHSGVQLEVNERILDSCNHLMKTIRVLIEKSKTLQREIVDSGRGTTGVKDFYKKHHRWTEGLISAAKAVGWGANVLVEGADRVVKGEGKFEELVVCSQEIAASTTQLVVSSKVKADRQSQNLKQVSEASKGVTNATAQVVASAKSGAQMIDEMDTLDFSKLTLHQAKRLEMDSQVRVLELESNLEKERVKLAELRKKHYQLAGESEGWEVEQEPESLPSSEDKEKLTRPPSEEKEKLTNGRPVVAPKPVVPQKPSMANS